MLSIQKNKRLDQYSCRKEDTQAKKERGKKLEEIFNDTFSKLLETMEYSNPTSR